MNTKWLALLSVLSTSVLAHANITPVEADYRCERTGGGVAFRLPNGSEPARVWQTDPGMEEGLELAVTGFRKLDCAECFEFRANMMRSALVTGTTEMALVSGKEIPVLTYLIESLDTEDKVTFGPLPCVRITSKRAHP